MPVAVASVPCLYDSMHCVLTWFAGTHYAHPVINAEC